PRRSRPRGAASAARNGNPLKKGTFATPKKKKALAKARACAIFRADSSSRGPRRRVSQPQNSRGVAQNGEKGWRTDEIRSPDNHLQRHRALPQASQRSVRFDGRGNQEEHERDRFVHHERDAAE